MKGHLSNFIYHCINSTNGKSSDPQPFSPLHFIFLNISAHLHPRKKKKKQQSKRKKHKPTTKKNLTSPLNILPWLPRVLYKLSAKSLLLRKLSPIAHEHVSPHTLTPFKFPQYSTHYPNAAHRSTTAFQVLAPDSLFAYFPAPNDTQRHVICGGNTNKLFSTDIDGACIHTVKALLNMTSRAEWFL